MKVGGIVGRLERRAVALSGRTVADRWADRFFDARNRLLTGGALQRFATAFPLTRPIARRRGRALFDLCAGFVYAQILLACVRLRLFETLSGGALPTADIARRIGLEPDAAHTLLKAAAALSLVEARSGGRFGLGMQGAAVLGEPGIAAMIEHHAMLYDDLRDPVALLKGAGGSTAIGRLWPYATGAAPGELTRADVAPYTALMAATQRLVASEVLAACPFRRHRMLLDVGGGDGAFLAAVARSQPELKLVLFDLPAVASAARGRFEREGIAGRAASVGGDFLRDRLPDGADIVTLVRVIHDHDDAAARAILAAVRRALPPDGTLVIAEPLAATAGAETIGDAYFGFYLLAMGSGRPRSAATLTAMLREAGFSRVRTVRARMPFLVSVLVART